MFSHCSFLPSTLFVNIQFTILLVGYFVLGPSDLYKLTKEIGKFVQNFRTFTTEATATLENNMESQLQLAEIRKAQRELTDAFSFRRSINVDESMDPFEVNAQSPRPSAEDEIIGGTAAAATAVAPDGTPTKKRKIRRVKKKAPVSESAPDDTSDDPFGVAEDDELANNVPDLDLDDDDLSESERRAMDSMQTAREELEKEQKAQAAKEAAAQTRKERMERLQRAQESSLEANDEMPAAEQSRFQQQLSGDWNSQILANNDKLDPLAGIMERLAVLEEEKIATDRRLQEEFKLREENEERFYRQKRELLEEAAAQIQANAYASTGTESSASK
jgi:Sec-independent protein translocase protein TatA